jgi:hypothetical protein
MSLENEFCQVLPTACLLSVVQSSWTCGELFHLYMNEFFYVLLV